jgi:DNA-binding MarR family transcriptional regulator
MMEPMARARPDGDVRLDPVLDFLRLLWSIEHRLQSLSKRMESDLGITGPQRLVLRVVGRYPGISAGALAHVVRLHPSTITGILQRLVAKGLLERQTDPSDSRRTLLRLRPRAAAYTHPSAGAVENAVRKALARAGAANVASARKVLVSMVETLGADG